MKPSLTVSRLIFNQELWHAGITVISSHYGIDATVAWCAKKSGKCQCFSFVDSCLDPGVSIKLALISDGSLAAKLKSIHRHLELNIICISHFSSESSRISCNHVQCLQFSITICGAF